MSDPQPIGELLDELLDRLRRNAPAATHDPNKGRRIAAYQRTRKATP